MAPVMVCLWSWQVKPACGFREDFFGNLANITIRYARTRIPGSSHERHGRRTRRVSRMMHRAAFLVPLRKVAQRPSLAI